ncbi:TonB-dependent hemin, ferrichrome receptor [Klebsiella pneumoniae subsp. ozaenae]|uniref:TonB-dependent hemin, ferrichrome receptor n=1 Tax=Klebsiella pneumoniae subsp. ozaenae TaxID=574 RepID=A0A378AFG4_KLEPO|nr:TonB-dependent hemin, ferrichrome receptor [Klebsiella pneumoniae subsp. ozaenae]
MGLKGEVTEGITLRTALFYNSYKNFIAYTRYTRAKQSGPVHECAVEHLHHLSGGKPR